MITLNSSPIHAVSWKLADDRSVRIDIKRDDLLHPVISGNKWRKLKHLISDAQQKGCLELISMGGNWSNHLHAQAYAGFSMGLKTRALVRAHPDQALTPTLLDCKKWGMVLEFTDRKTYAELRQKISWDSFDSEYPGSYWFSEGGFSSLAIQGVEDMKAEVDCKYDYIFAGCGSGATVCGLARAFPESYVVGVAAFSGADYLKETLSQHLKQAGRKAENWTIDTKHHCGGFAKSSEELETLIEELELFNSFKLDPIYNGKTFLALNSWLCSATIPSGSRVLVIHTGGLQGARKT